jgi:hypothetical protein
MNETSQLRHACIREFRERSVEKKKTRQDKTRKLGGMKTLPGQRGRMPPSWDIWKIRVNGHAGLQVPVFRSLDRIIYIGFTSLNSSKTII